jgi:RNA polymerase sigma factor (sigma-70 family)
MAAACRAAHHEKPPPPRERRPLQGMAAIEACFRSVEETADPPAIVAAGLQLERLHNDHGERVRAMCRALLRDADEAEDAAQQVFLSALRSLHRGSVPRDAGAWLATIARHECWARSRGSRTAPLHAELPDLSAEDPSATALRRAELADTWRTIAGLPRRQREVLLLREVRGLGYDELAENLRLSRPSVRSLLTRARHTLRTQLEQGAAALAGAPWLNGVARLFGEGSNPEVSAITRTAAVGLGALALTGGAVVAPRLAPNSHQHRATVQVSAPQRSAARQPSQNVQSSAVPVLRASAVVATGARAAAPAHTVRDTARSDKGERGARGHRGPDGGGDTSHIGRSDDGRDGGGQADPSSGPGPAGSGSGPRPADRSGSSDSHGGDSSGGSGSSSSGNPGSGEPSSSGVDGGSGGTTTGDSSGSNASGSTSGPSGPSSSGVDGGSGGSTTEDSSGSSVSGSTSAPITAPDTTSGSSGSAGSDGLGRSESGPGGSGSGGH